MERPALCAKRSGRRSRRGSCRYTERNLEQLRAMLGRSRYRQEFEAGKGRRFETALDLAIGIASERHLPGPGFAHA